MFIFFIIPFKTNASLTMLVPPLIGTVKPTIYKEPVIISEKQTEFENKIKLAEDNIKIIQNKLIDRYDYLLNEINNLIKAKNDEFILEQDMSAQIELINDIDCLNSIQRKFDFKKNDVFNGSNSNYYFYRYLGGVKDRADGYYSSPPILADGCQIPSDDIVLQSYIDKYDEMFSYKKELDQKYIFTLKSEIADPSQLLSHLYEIYEDERVPYCNQWTYTDWTSCSSKGEQKRKVLSSFPVNCIDGDPILSQSCGLPICKSWIYSNWSECINNQQTRTITSSSPSDCVNGNPILSRSCESELNEEIIEEEIIPVARIDMDLSNRLKGKLLLQVNQGGRIWYVNPDDSKRFEITFANVLPLFENFALGITDSNLKDIPKHDEDRSSALGDGLKGKLLLQVEQGGRIWYVDFDGKRWEVTWNNLMELFESLALGIADEDLFKINAGEL